VIALCPNCHYRVHHGEDGDAYNQELIEVLASKENVSVEAITPNE
jgi:predicted HNH restriction endonuclease